MTSLQWTEPATENQAPNIRIIFLDALRGLAVLGIYWINIIIFAQESSSQIMLTTGLSVFNTDLFTGPITDDIIEGTMRGLFSILFGASAMVFLNEAKLIAQGLDVVDRYYRRTLLLVFFGFFHAYFLLWPYDVLYIYGILGMFLFPLRKMSASTLLVVGVVLLLIGDINIEDRISNTNQTTVEEQASKLSNIIEETDRTIALKTLNAPIEEPVQTDQSSEILSESTRLTYFQYFQKNLSDVIYQQSSKLYTTYLFDVGGMMIIGMALLKLGILLGNKSRKFYLTLMLTGYIIGFITRDSFVYNFLVNVFNLTDTFDESLLGYNLGRLFVTLGHIGLMGLLLNVKLVNPISNILVATGRLALTNYIMQTVFSLLIFYAFANELTQTFPGIEVTYILLSVWIFQITFSVIWLRYLKLGPVEWIWRSLIYGKVQAIRRHQEA